MYQVAKKLFYVAYFILGAAIAGMLFYLVILLIGNHVIDKEKLVMSTTTKIVDENGHEISKLYLENRETVPLNKIPKNVQNAFVATEDSRFYEHSGIDLRGTMRAVVADIFSGQKEQGGSTITQQLARNAFLTNEKTWYRKLKEAAIAISMERKYSKKQILDMYLNQIYFGHGVYGVEAASKFFFNKDVSQLSDDEGALLAALPKGPNEYSPILHPDRALNRRNLVVDLMEKQGYIGAEQAVRLKGRTLGLNLEKSKSHPEYDTYVDMVLDEAQKEYHLSNDEVLRGGYKIVVPMDMAAQRASYQQFKKNQYFRGSNPKVSPQGAFVLMDSQTGGVLAVQGGRSYVKKGYNHVLEQRQPGSTFKPLAVYGPALDSGRYQPFSLLQDKKVVYTKYDNYAPKNYDNQYHGEMSMYDAVTVSQNAPAVWLLDKIGINKSKAYLSKLGFQLPDKGLAIALGGLEKGVTPLQMASAYTAFDNNGEKVSPYFIKAIYSNSGKRLGKAHPKKEKVFSKQTAWYMTRMLESVVSNGTAKAGVADTSLAGKTGSTAYTKNGLRDAWFVGYTPKAVGAVWMGYDQTAKNQYLTGSSSDAVRLFKSIIDRVPSQAHLPFKKPAQVTDLDAPIKLEPIKNLKAKGTFGKFIFPAVKFTWTAAKDKRVVYRIYEVDNGKTTLKGEVAGKGSFEINYVNPISSASYYVVPYNPQTKKQGIKSRTVQISWLSGL